MFLFLVFTAILAISGSSTDTPQDYSPSAPAPHQQQTAPKKECTCPKEPAPAPAHVVHRQAQEKPKSPEKKPKVAPQKHPLPVKAPPKSASPQHSSYATPAPKPSPSSYAPPPPSDSYDETPPVANDFNAQDIPADLSIPAPKGLLTISFAAGDVTTGQNLTQAEVAQAPTVNLQSDGTLLTFVMLDPDAPDRITHTYRSYLHWLVVNIPANSVDDGNVVMPYAGPTPPQGSGPHRYTLMTFKQTKPIDQTTLAITDRVNFNIENFATTQELAGPELGNFFLVENP